MGTFAARAATLMGVVEAEHEAVHDVGTEDVKLLDEFSFETWVPAAAEF